jgi:hypothetical protein
MTQKQSKNDKNGSSKVAGIGLGLTAAAVTAAGAYFLYGSKKAVQNRKKVKGWVLKAKGEVLEALEKAEAITEDEYKALVEAATGAYGTMKHATIGEVKDFKKEMQEHWLKLQKSNVVKKIGKTKAQAAKVAPKKASTKKAVPKTASKKVIKKST